MAWKPFLLLLPMWEPAVRFYPDTPGEQIAGVLRRHAERLKLVAPDAPPELDEATQTRVRALLHLRGYLLGGQPCTTRRGPRRMSAVFLTSRPVEAYLLGGSEGPQLVTLPEKSLVGVEVEGTPLEKILSLLEQAPDACFHLELEDEGHCKIEEGGEKPRIEVDPMAKFRAEQEKRAAEGK